MKQELLENGCDEKYRGQPLREYKRSSENGSNSREASNVEEESPDFRVSDTLSWSGSADESEMSPSMSESHGHCTEERSLLLGGGGARTPGHDVESDPVPRSSGQGSSSSPLANILGQLKSTWLFHEPWFAFMLCPTFAYFYVYYAWLLFLIPNAEWLGIPSSRAVLLATIVGGFGIVGRVIFLITDYLNVDVFYLYAVSSVTSSAVFFVYPLG